MKASPGGNITRLCTNIKNCIPTLTLRQAVVQSLPVKSPVLEQLLLVHRRWHWLFHAGGYDSSPGFPCIHTWSSYVVQYTALCLVV